MLEHDLNAQLDGARRACQRQDALGFAWRALKYAPLALLALFAADLIWQLDARWRAGLGVAALAAAGACAGWAIYLAGARRQSLERTARLLESREPSLGSKLINYLQLRTEAAAQPPLTRQLTEMALADYSARLAKIDLNPLTRLPELRRLMRQTGIALGLGAILFACFFPISTLEVLRFADPFGDHPPYSSIRIEIAEPAADGATVVYNQGIVIKATAAGHRPGELYLSFYDPAKPAEVRTVPMFSKGDLGFLQEIAGVKSDLLVYAHTRDGASVSRKRLVKVALTPMLDHAFVTITPPAYTGLKPAETPFDFKEVRALAGSQIQFRVRSNRPLSGGSIEMQSEGAPAAPILMQPSAENEVIGAFQAADSGRLKFSMVDVAHHVSQQNLSASLTVTHDQPPEVHIEQPEGDSFVCEDFKVQARVVATDDYGLKNVQIHRALNDRFSAPKSISYPIGTTAATEHADFDIADLGVQPGDVISFFAEAVDTCPEAHLVRSQTVHLMVISTEDYNNSLRERSDISDIEGKYSDLLSEFQEDVDEQKAISDQIAAIQAAKPSQASQEQIDKLLAQQSELNQKLADMAGRMEKFVRDKPLYDIEKDLQQILTQKAAEIRASLAESNSTLQKVAQPPPPGGASQEKRLEALASLHKQSDAQLAQLQQSHQDAENKIVPPLEDAEKMNALISDLNQFKTLYEAQAATVEQVSPMQHLVHLSDTDLLALKQAAGTEREMQWGLEEVAAHLRAHAKDAEKLFPKAANSARDFADGMERASLSGLAGHAAVPMLAGAANDSYQSAENLRQEMDKFFHDAESQGSGEGPMCTEMDKYLRLNRGLSPGETFKQMAQGQKSGFGKGGQGSGSQGQGGPAGYASAVGENIGLLGSETFSGQPQHSGDGGHSQLKPSGPGQTAQAVDSDVLRGVPDVTRATGGVQTEGTVEGYRDAIDAYFNTITK
jgi:hypothetical protein